MVRGDKGSEPLFMSISCLRCITEEIKGNNCTVAKCNLCLDIIKRVVQGGEKKNKKEENREETKTRGYRQKRGLMGRDKMVGRMRRKEVTSTKQTTYHSTAVALIYYGIYSQIRCLSVCVCVCVCFVARTFSFALLEFDYWTGR